ncbi:ABC transporter substrate-binding protein [Desulfobacter hydrogenophilus]|uniref:ABC transporter substrate-binding protein n=2 Tax=Desulfobacter hydrogenophilus TaxID=2291 RepID=A0A328FG44_9BACT|nr:ABC transporter substrate-binding protein [Desulfobacter hydrogenophilus]QBH15663.1 ABC transporter substrate-binding protein [Desulfobacter hydrogenophilus]RAM02790.1 ABC transporter substrate-binding protein [Desulfobacter hydrogenophilus]
MPVQSHADNVVRDTAGRSIRVDAPFTRIISLYGAHTRNLKNLGLDDEIIGICPMDVWAGKRTFSYHDGLEKFLAARPDLVLIRPMIDLAYTALVKGMEKAGIIVVSLQPGSVDEMFDYWIALGVLTGKVNQARQMVCSFKNEIAGIQAVTQAIADKKQVYFEAIHSRMKTFTPGAMAIFALETAGGVNLAQDAPSVRGTNIAFYGKERILSHAHEIDVFLAQKGAMNQPTIEMIKNEPGFDVIRAVKENQIFIVDEKIVSRPTMDLLKGIHTIADMLYPGMLEKGGVQ